MGDEVNGCFKVNGNVDDGSDDDDTVDDGTVGDDRRKKQIDVAEFEIVKNGFSSRSLRRYYEAITIKKSSIQILITRSKKKAEELFLFIS